MMIQFNLNRFGHMLKWSLTNDKRYFVKSFLQIFVIMLLGFLFFTVMNSNEAHSEGYQISCIMVMTIFIVTVVFGPSFMFYSMENKHDMQNLLMLPASNLEKYLTRYATWLFLLPLYLVAYFAADLMQYLIHWILGHDYGMLVTSRLADILGEMWRTMPRNAIHAILVIAIWMHAFYALGVTFFRSRKYNWVMTSIVGVVLTIMVIRLIPMKEYTSSQEATTTAIVAIDVITALWVILNFWLSYKLFCRTQVIGKFVNF